MRVLIACEESQTVCKAFRALGHEAYSNDLQECSGGHPEWHMHMDIHDALSATSAWDLIIMHPPCTCLSLSGNRWYGKGMPRHQERLDALDWTYKLWITAKKRCSYVALENPTSVIFKELAARVQYIHPWQFGHGEQKKTGLALHGLPPLEPTNIVEGREQRIWKMGPSPERAKLRSKTFPGVAEAMASQWGGLKI